LDTGKPNAVDPWVFPDNRWLGAIVSTLPAQFALEIIGWRGIFVGLTAAILATAAAIFLLSPEPAPREHRVQPTLRSLVEVYRNAAFRRTVFIVLVPHTTYFGIQSLWMGSWLHDVVGYSPRMIAGYLFAGMTAMVIGTIAVGHITQYAGKRGYTTLDVAAIGLLIFAFVQLSIALDIKWMRPTCGVQSLGEKWAFWRIMS
jgi:predicted MFS family arabinose efflux permease